MSAPTAARDPLYRGYRFPAEIISHAVWLYYRFALSHRDIEELLAERASGSATRPSGCGAARLAPPWLPTCAATGGVPVASGTWTRCS